MLDLVFPIVLVAAAAGFAVSFISSTDRAECSGVIVCPITGNLDCEDRCPAGEGSAAADTSTPDAMTPACCTDKVNEAQSLRPDCPGKIICPITGDPICQDRCPLGEEQGQETALPTCCPESN